jgi:hypothetical protein
MNNDKSAGSQPFIPMDKKMPKYVQIRKLPNDLAKLLARPDFGSFLAEHRQVDKALELQLNTQSASVRALFLVLAGYSSLMNRSMERHRPPHVLSEQLTQGLAANAPTIRSIALSQMPDEVRMLLEANEFSKHIPRESALDAWTSHHLDLGAPPTRALFLIYEGLATLIGDRPLSQPPQTSLEARAKGGSTESRINASSVAEEAAEAVAAADTQGANQEPQNSGFRSILPEDSPVWLALSKGKG